MSPRFASASDQAGRARVGTDVLEGAQAVRAERLEESQLRLHADDVRRDRVHDPAAEAAAGVGRRVGREVRVAGELDGQQVGPWVEPDQELRVLPLDRLGGTSEKSAVATAGSAPTRLRG